MINSSSRNAEPGSESVKMVPKDPPPPSIHHLVYDPPLNPGWAYGSL